MEERTKIKPDRFETITRKLVNDGRRGRGIITPVQKLLAPHPKHSAGGSSSLKLEREPGT